MRIILFLAICSITSFSFGQEEEEPKFVKKTFYSSRVVNSHTTVSPEKKTLDFRINHRFGALSGGGYEFFGLDQASMRISFDYGITDNFTAGIGRSTFDKTYDGFLKYRFLRQTEENEVPISMAFVSAMSYSTVKWPIPGRTNYETSRMNYTHQLVLAKKFSPKFSLQLMPTLLHRNLIDSSQYKNDVMSMGFALRQKIIPSVTLNVEYFYLFPNQISESYTHPLSIGFDISTGWHTFQIHLTNATGTFEKAVLAQTVNRWDKGQIHFGFNISREFHLGGY
jgi:hypothetical protein